MGLTEGCSTNACSVVEERTLQRRVKRAFICRASAPVDGFLGVTTETTTTAKQFAEKLDFGFVLKGRGFQPRRKCRKINRGFSRRGHIRSAR